MTRISKYRLKEAVFERIYDLFCEVLMHNRRKDDFIGLMNDLLTPSERIMIAKRVALLYLLERNVPQIVIAETLHISSSTVSTWSLIYEKNSGIKKTLTQIKGRKDITAFFEDIFADLFIQPGFKIGHWESYWQDKKRRSRKVTGGI